jgi:hypothetical protein
VDYVSERRVSTISAKLLIAGGPIMVTNAVTIEIDFGGAGVGTLRNRHFTDQSMLSSLERSTMNIVS